MFNIGYTTGVFDMFHIGHLKIIKRAKLQCNKLVVGVSSDDLVKSYKNKLPVIPFEDRFQILSSIKYVDEVVIQSSRDKVQAHTDIGFDAMFVGDDWKGKPLFQEAEKVLRSRGVEVVYFPYTAHVSSTKLTETLTKIEENGAGI